jgi:two-component system KDP operon response regulator KdpE
VFAARKPNGICPNLLFELGLWVAYSQVAVLKRFEVPMAALHQGFRTMIEDSPANDDRRKEGLRILLIGKDNSMIEILSAALKSAGYGVYPVGTGKESLRKFQSVRPDLILLDLPLPERDGKQVLQRLREWTTAPIIVMSVRQEESEKIACLDTGADDYVTKPFSMGELLARLRAALRRVFGRSEVFRAGELKLDFYRREVFVGNEKVKLTATEYDLLKLLATHAGAVRTHYQLVHALWGSSQYQDVVHLLRVTVSNLRRKLEGDAGIVRHIVTEPGVGYRLRDDYDCFQARGSL